MAGIIPIPTTRVGDYFVRQRLSNQVLNDQLELFRLQSQISTGRRIQVPSEDAPAALRAINLQRLIDRKEQIRTNVVASKQYVGAAESRIGTISDALIQLRGSVLEITGNVVTDEARQAVLQQINSLLPELVGASNAKMGDRYLFSGSRSQDQPYDYNGQFVEYRGNHGVLRSYVDIEQLFETNMSGTDVFGGISSAIEGSVDVNPQLKPDTLLSSLHGGTGIGLNPAIELSVNNGAATTSAVIDLRKAVTVRDVALLIERGAPPGTNVTVEITGSGLVLHGNGDDLTVTEVAEGRTARLLGIASNPHVPATDTITGRDLNPALLKTTRLADILGQRAQGVFSFAGGNNDLHLAANTNGGQFNNLNLVLAGGATAGAEVATYDAGTNTLTVNIQSGISTAQQVAAAINTEGTFTATSDHHDATSQVQQGTGTISLGSLSPASTTAGGEGDVLDLASGLHLTNANKTLELDINGAETVEDLLNLINGAEMGFVAEINAAANGINIRSHISGAQFAIGELGGTTATQLGLRTYTADTELAALNHGFGVPTTSALETIDASKLDQFRIVARNGAALNVNLAGATTMQDVVTRINTHANNNTGTTAVLARLIAGGNNIELVDSSTAATGRLTVEAPSGSTAAQYLGLVPASATQNVSVDSGSGGTDVLTGNKVLGNDFAIVARNGTQLSVDLAGAKTIQDVIDRINANPDNVPPIITAQLARTGNGIELIDSSTGTGTLTVQVAEGSQAAQYLGFVAQGQTQSSPDSVTTEGGTQVLQSADRNTRETASVFTTLINLRDAIQNQDIEAVGRLLDTIDTDLNRLNLARAELGGRLQNLDVIGVRLEDENVELRAALSEDIDVDLVKAISELTARQYAFEASLRSSASLMQMSLLNFL